MSRATRYCISTRTTPAAQTSNCLESRSTRYLLYVAGCFPEKNWVPGVEVRVLDHACFFMHCCTYIYTQMGIIISTLGNDPRRYVPLNPPSPYRRPQMCRTPYTYLYHTRTMSWSMYLWEMYICTLMFRDSDLFIRLDRVYTAVDSCGLTCDPYGTHRVPGTSINMCLISSGIILYKQISDLVYCIYWSGLCTRTRVYLIQLISYQVYMIYTSYNSHSLVPCWSISCVCSWNHTRNIFFAPCIYSYNTSTKYTGKKDDTFIPGILCVLHIQAFFPSTTTEY